MFQARQKQLIHETNVAVVNIRSSELDYFTNFFSNLGINAAVGFGLIAGSVSQVPGYDNPSGCWYGFVYLYNISSALTVVTSILALIMEIYIVVYGNGLALRGPVGSMVKAIDGMVEEQQAIFWAFNWTIFFLALQQIGMYFIMMDSISGWISGVITVVAMISWYRYGLRLYNRFNWQQIEVAWKEHEDEEKKKHNSYKPPVDDDDIDPITRLQQQLECQKQMTAAAATAAAAAAAANNPSSNASKSNKNLFFKGKSAKTINDNEDNGPTDAYEASFLASQPSGAETEPSSPSMGFLSIRVPKKQSLFSKLRITDKDHARDWKRRFFLVQGSQIFYYPDRNAYESQPTKPLNTRPIELDGYTLVAGGQVAPYYLSLIPADPEDDRKAWKFRCDTLSEFEHWLEAFTQALKQCPSWRASETTDFVDIAAGHQLQHDSDEEDED